MDTSDVKEVDEAMCVPTKNAKNGVGNKKQKVWTKLRNGMYGWRMVRTRLAKHTDLKLIPGAGTPTSTLGQSKWVPAQIEATKISKIKPGNANEMKKRKYTFEGGGDSDLGKKSKSMEKNEEQRNDGEDEMNGTANLSIKGEPIV